MTKQGWQVIARNYRRPGFELDLVICKGRTVAAVEVKARRTPPTIGRQVEGLLPRKKIISLINGTRSFATTCELDVEVFRIDLVLVWPGGIKYYPAVIDCH